MQTTIDITTPLTQLEAGRVKTEIETIHGKKIKYRFLTGFSPEKIASTLTAVKVKPEDIARYAGREK